MATIETHIDIKVLKASGKRGHELVKWAYEVLRYDGENWSIQQFMQARYMSIISMLLVCLAIALPHCVTGQVTATNQYSQSASMAELIGECVTYASY